MERMQGTWRIISYSEEGLEDPRNHFIGGKVEFREHRLTLVDKFGTATAGRFAVSARENPKRLDWIVKLDENADDLSIAHGAGIYEFDKDLLVLCVRADQPVLAGRKRPTAFETKRNDGRFMVILKKR